MATAAVAGLRSWLDSKVANINNAPSGGFAGSITCALFLQRFVEAPKAGCMSISTAGRRRQNRRALKAANARPRARSTNCWANAMDDPRLTPARPDLAAKYLEGKVKAARFVAGEKFEIRRASRRCARSRPPMPAGDPGAEGRARHHLRSQRRRLGLGPVEQRRLCRLASRSRAGKARRAPTHKVTAFGPSRFRAPRSNCRRSKRL